MYKVQERAHGIGGRTQLEHQRAQENRNERKVKMVSNPYEKQKSME